MFKIEWQLEGETIWHTNGRVFETEEDADDSARAYRKYLWDPATQFRVVPVD